MYKCRRRRFLAFKLGAAFIVGIVTLKISLFKEDDGAELLDNQMQFQPLVQPMSRVSKQALKDGYEYREYRTKTDNEHGGKNDHKLKDIEPLEGWDRIDQMEDDNQLREDDLAKIAKRTSSRHHISLQTDLTLHRIETEAQENYPGAMGKPVILKNISPKMKIEIEEGWKLHEFNKYVSDMIPINRSLPDLRNEWCFKAGRYYSYPDLPSTSIVITFHNEDLHVLLRSLASIINRSEPRLIREIILVDDASTYQDLKTDLDESIQKLFPRTNIKIIRTGERIGLIKGRITGFYASTASIVTFLDSHIEATPGWLEPLLLTIHINRTTVVTPVIDVIDHKSMQYQSGDEGSISVGGFNWELIFDWHLVPETENRRRGHPSAPIRSPTMAGGLFAIDRDFFLHLGLYDPEFKIWGGENLELSFKVWMCGGTLLTLPCSHVGHIFREKSPYDWGPGDVVSWNTVRLAEVWLDDYKNFYYQRIGSRLTDFGDVSERQALRRRLKCHSFKWYLDNVYPELFVPSDAVANGAIANPRTNLCVDSNAEEKEEKEVKPYPCHGMGGNQYWMMSKAGEIRRDDMCIDSGNTSEDIRVVGCHGLGGNQAWSYDMDTLLLRINGTNRCLAVKNSEKLSMEECDELDLLQFWYMENYQTQKLRRRH